MNERPPCEIPNCKNGAMFIINEKKICGSCYAKYYRKMINKNWKDIKDATK